MENKQTYTKEEVIQDYNERFNKLFAEVNAMLPKEISKFVSCEDFSTRHPQYNYDSKSLENLTDELFHSDEFYELTDIELIISDFSDESNGIILHILYGENYADFLKEMYKEQIEQLPNVIKNNINWIRLEDEAEANSDIYEYKGDDYVIY